MHSTAASPVLPCLILWRRWTVSWRRLECQKNQSHPRCRQRPSTRHRRSFDAVFPRPSAESAPPILLSADLVVFKYRYVASRTVTASSKSELYMDVLFVDKFQRVFAKIPKFSKKCLNLSALTLIFSNHIHNTLCPWLLPLSSWPSARPQCSANPPASPPIPSTLPPKQPVRPRSLAGAGPL